MGTSAVRAGKLTVGLRVSKHPHLVGPVTVKLKPRSLMLAETLPQECRWWFGRHAAVNIQIIQTGFADSGRPGRAHGS